MNQKEGNPLSRCRSKRGAGGEAFNLPWYSPKGTNVNFGNDVSVSVSSIGDSEFFEVCLIVHVPAKND